MDLDWIWHRGVCGRWLQRAASGSRWTRNDDGLCWLWGDSEGEQQVFIGPDFGVWFLKVIIRDSYIATCTVGYSIWWSKRLVYSSSSSNCQLFAISHIFLYLFLSTNITFLLRQNRLFVTTVPILALRLLQNVARIASSTFTSQASKPHAALTPMYQCT